MAFLPFLRFLFFFDFCSSSVSSTTAFVSSTSNGAGSSTFSITLSIAASCVSSGVCSYSGLALDLDLRFCFFEIFAVSSIFFSSSLCCSSCFYRASAFSNSASASLSASWTAFRSSARVSLTFLNFLPVGCALAAFSDFSVGFFLFFCLSSASFSSLSAASRSFCSELTPFSSKSSKMTSSLSSPVDLSANSVCWGFYVATGTKVLSLALFCSGIGFGSQSSNGCSSVRS